MPSDVLPRHVHVPTAFEPTANRLRRELTRLVRLGRRRIRKRGAVSLFPLYVVIGIFLFFFVVINSSDLAHNQWKVARSAIAFRTRKAYWALTFQGDGKLPGPGPTYDDIFAFEKALPQHNLDLLPPEGRHGRYLKFSNQIVALGWNNVLGEVLMNAHLAWRTNRAYVFRDYQWKVAYYPWSIPEWPWPHTPLNALIRGPVAGGSWGPGDNTPRAIHESHWDSVCPPEDTQIIDSDFGKDPVRWEDGVTIMEHWVKLLDETPARCVDIQPGASKKDGYPQVFDLWLVSTKRVLGLWPEFRDSPVSQLLRTAPVVEAAIQRNTPLFRLRGEDDPGVYDHMMAVHIRRGDFEGACKSLADWNSTFYGWNLLPSHPDDFVPTAGGGWGWNTEENMQLYRERCMATDENLKRKIQSSKEEWEAEQVKQGKNEKLRVLYVMTNAKKDWVDRSFKPMMKSMGWESIVSSHDLVLNDEQLGVSMAVDMEYGRLAAVFVGNGWSSMTSNINHRRLVDGRQPLDNRFW